MAQGNSRGMDSGFIELAQEQLDEVDARLAEIAREIAALQDERATLSEQRMHLQGIVSPSAKMNGARGGKADVQSTRDAVADLIRKNGAPMHYRNDIYPCLVETGHEIGGKDPANTLLSRIFNDERLRRTAPGVYALVEQGGRRPPPPPKPAPSTSRLSAVLKAAEKVLRDAGQPLHPDEIAKRALRAGLWKSSGRTPGATIGARVYQDIQKHGERSPFVKVHRGVFGLRERDEAEV